MRLRPHAAPALLLCLVLAGCGRHADPAPAAASAPVAAASAPRPAASEVIAQLREVLAAHRQIIVLFADEKRQTQAERATADEVGQAIFHANREHVATIEAMFEAITGAGDDPTPVLAPVLDWIESDPTLFDADRLAFRDLLPTLQADVARNSTLGAIRLHKRVGDDIEALDEIQKNYDEEIRAIFSRFEQRAIVQKRERWDDYLAHLAQLYTRDQILQAHRATPVAAASAPASTVAAASAPASRPIAAAKPEPGEIFGTSLPPKVVALTFDDGPHPVYTAEITDILKQYGAPGTFFEVGNNLGTIGPDGAPHLSRNAEISRHLLAEGYIVGNHSMTHAQLSKKAGDELRDEILNNDKLLKATAPARPPLFRFPYGARNAEGKALLAQAHLQSVMWNVDSMDWADPVPNSIADRVMREIDRNGRGIVLFHDIHERTVKALPLVMSRLVAEGYQFAGWDGKQFTVMKPGATRGFEPVTDAAPGAAPAASAAAVSLNTTEGESWAVVVGVDDYAHWPRLGHAVRDAEAVKGLLVGKLGFKAAHVITLENQAATRTNVLAAFNEQLPKAGLKKTDNLFVFFAGHGATQHLSSGRDLGYIVPVDASTDDFATSAIPMTELQNISEGLVARHAIFIMDACYSGLGLVRGGGAGANNGNFLRDNAHRIGRQMLTAGGADQMVADGGPGGHSIFTWTLLQGLSGKADLNGDNIITATELAAYVAPAVASVSAQTPAFGSLPGSEGGEFVFTLAANDEYISDATPQLAGDAIALNTKLDKTAAAAAASAATTGLVVKDLQGQDQKIAAPAAAPVTDRQQARQADDRGMQLFKEKNYAAARDQFAQALKLQPDFALAANNLGFVYWKTGDDAQAVKYFEAALKIDPSRAVAYVNLGDALQRQGHKDEARKAFETYLQLAPNGGLAQHAREAVAAN